MEFWSQIDFGGSSWMGLGFWFLEFLCFVSLLLWSCVSGLEMKLAGF